MRPLLLLCAFLVALVAGLAATSFLIQPPAARTSGPDQDHSGRFNAVRAKARLALILGHEAPHPADSFGDDAVRARLIGQIRAIGLTPIVRDQFACNQIYKQRGVSCARVRNVIVPLGPAAGKTLLLNAHYDSTPVGPAAADDGVGVATLLEVAAVLKNERLRRPVILLFNEGEELGLVGARAFMADPLSRRVDSLVNLEARGVSGPVTMFETSLPNGPPVRAFARAVDRPFANSLATDFYRQLPNYTDVNSFSERGWLTLNFAMIGNETRYHSPGDTVAALDLRSLQHMGDQTLAVTRELASGTPRGGATMLFADIAGRQLVMLPQEVGFVLLAVLVLGFAIASFSRGVLWRGLALMAVAILVSAALAWGAFTLMELLRAGSFWRAYPLWTHLASYGCGIAGATGAIAILGRRLTVEQLRASLWLGFLLLGVAVLLIAPGGVIYFLLPPLVALIGIIARRWAPWAERVAMIAAALALWLTFGEVLALLGQLMVNGPFFIFAPLAMLVAMPWLVEAKPLFAASGHWTATVAAVALALIGWAAVAAAPAYSADRQQRFTIQHVTETGEQRAYWAVANDGAPLPKGFGGETRWRRGKLPNIDAQRWLTPAAAIAGLQPPKLRIVGRTHSSKGRTVAFRIEANGAQSVTLIAAKDAQLLSAGSGDFVRPFDGRSNGRFFIECSGRSCDGATMQFTTARKGPIALTLVGSTRGLPETARPLLEGRPQNARPQYAPDSTLTVSRLAL